MPTIIKAADPAPAPQPVAFHLADLTAQANRCLEQVRSQAARIVAQAREEAQSIRQQAEDEGRRAAAGSLQQQVAAQAASQLATLLPALSAAVEEIRQAQSAWRAHWEKAAVHLATAIAAKILRRELARDPEIPVTLVREALELAAGNSQLRIHLHPDDHRRLDGQIEALVREIAPLATTELLSDPGISPGGCRLDTRFGSIDQQFESQLARIEEELT